MKNVNYLELQYGEVSWRSDALTPAERFVDGSIHVPDRPGVGMELNEASFALGRCLSEGRKQNAATLIAKLQHRPAMRDLPGVQDDAGQLIAKWACLNG